MTKISVIGLGKAGLPLATVIADAGFMVTGVDVNPDRVKKINEGINPITEEVGLSELIKKHYGTRSNTQHRDRRVRGGIPKALWRIPRR